MSSRQENAVALQLAEVYGEDQIVRVQPGSGNQAFAPNDVRVANELMVECKSTARLSITITYAWLERVRRLSAVDNLRCALAIQFSAFTRTQFYVIEDIEYLHLLACEKELKRLTK